MMDFLLFFLPLSVAGNADGWTFDEQYSVNGLLAFYKEEEIKGKFID